MDVKANAALYERSRSLNCLAEVVRDSKRSRRYSGGGWNRGRVISPCLQQASKRGLLGCDVLTRSSIQCRAAQKLQITSIGPISSCSVIWRTVVIGPRSSCSVIERTVGGRGWINIGGRGWINTGGRGWINTGGGAVVAEAVAEVVAAVV